MCYQHQIPKYLDLNRMTQFLSVTICNLAVKVSKDKIDPWHFIDCGLVIVMWSPPSISLISWLKANNVVDSEHVQNCGVFGQAYCGPHYGGPILLSCVFRFPKVGFMAVRKPDYELLWLVDTGDILVPLGSMLWGPWPHILSTWYWNMILAHLSRLSLHTPAW